LLIERSESIKIFVAMTDEKICSEILLGTSSWSRIYTDENPTFLKGAWHLRVKSKPTGNLIIEYGRLQKIW